jgi:nucleoside-diphosphate-sugar epimerase
MRLGRVRTPLVESDPQPQHLAPNFYYHQESLLHEFCKNNQETSWNVVRPAGIIGVVPRTAMNIIYTFRVYAAVQAEKGQPLVFRGDESA